MTKQTSHKFSPEVRERAVRMVFDQSGNIPRLVKGYARRQDQRCPDATNRLHPVAFVIVAVVLDTVAVKGRYG